ncbi:MAG: autotransporter outer membrane beta-barrel domain-containing protein [Alphaproteobacteria bacterium]|nr:autotransporter outer membrane beta-barrel domain-containing protein [Alphaproteobacteria bacterium]
MIFLCTVLPAIAASEFTNAPYLNTAATAWGRVLDNFGGGGAVAYQLNNARNTDPARFQKFLSVVAYNDAALTLYDTLQKIDLNFRATTAPLSSRRTNCTYNLPNCRHAHRHMDVDATAVATYNRFDSGNNTNFRTRNHGAHIRATGYLTDGIALGVAYSYLDTQSRQTAPQTNATTNTLTLFSEYLGKTGIFINMGLAGGNTSWQSDKTIAGVLNTSAYDTDFIATQINSGIALTRGLFTIIPHLGARYARLYTHKHIDAAAQEFRKWWYNTLTGMGGLKLGYDFIGTWFLVRPTLNAGLSYDFITNGTEKITVRLLNGDRYQMPIATPHRTAFTGGIGLEFISNYFNIGFSYDLDIRSDYTAHTGMLNIKFTF